MLHILDPCVGLLGVLLYVLFVRISYVC